MNDAGKHRFTLLLVIGLIALLPILAALQYYWLGQLRASELDRLRSNLQASARNFGHAIDHEVYPAQWAFRVSFTQSLDEIARQFRSGYTIWKSRTTQPEIIEAIYWVEYDLNNELQLYRFDALDGALRPTPWPRDLHDWRTYFIERSKRQLHFYQPLYTDHVEHPAADEDFLRMGARLMVTRPAIIVPVSIDSDIDSQYLLDNLNATSLGRAGHALITLNRDYLVDTFFPALVDTLVAPIGANVDLMIVSNTDSTRVIYQTDPSLTVADFAVPDAEQRIARFRWMPFTPPSRLARGYASLMERDRLIADSLVNQVQQAWPNGSSMPPTDPVTYQTDYPVQAIIRLAQEENYEGELTAEHLLMALSRLHQAPLETSPPAPNVAKSNTTPSSPPAVSSPPAHAWRVLLQHEKGSLEAVVEANQRRNLFLSFGILSILGVAVLLVYNSSQRSRHLAERQMDFVAGVSHELRTPVSVILSAAQNLADGVVSDTHRLKRYGELIHKEGKRLSDMVEQILELAGIQSGKNTYAREKIQVDLLISGVLDDWEETIQEQGFCVSTRIDENLPSIEGDPRTLRMALSNLISNAVKYSENDRCIEVRARRRNSSARKCELLIEVEDQGSGIPPEEHKAIFEQFYRGRAALDAQIHGNGIGLSIVRKTMEAHRGRVSVKSQIGAGSTFTLHFPI